MAAFMVHGTFQPQDRQNILALIPQERERINFLREQGVVKALYIASDSPDFWLVVQGESQAKVQQDLKSLPLYPYMMLYYWTPLSGI